MRCLLCGIFLFLATFPLAAAPGPFRIQISPANGMVVSGQTRQLTSTGRFLSHSGVGGNNLTNASAWKSSDPTIATVSATGLVTSIALGTVTISTSTGPFRGSTKITVIPNLSVTSLVITPANPSVPAGLTQQFTATATYSDNSTQDVTSASAWTSSDTSKATIDSSGLARTRAPGTTTISATFVGASNTAGNSTVLTVTPPLVTSIRVTPASIAIPYAGTQQFTAVGTFTDGSMLDITTTAAWSSNTPAEVGVNAAGLATGLHVGGPATISATQNSVIGIATVIAVTFSNASLNGQYAFSFQGSDNTNGPLVAAGSFQADGQGHLSNGVLDFNDRGGVIPNQSFSGTYSVGPDGRASAAITGTLGNTTFHFVLTANGDSAITQFDTSVVASGILKKQNPSAFNAGALNGPFAFSLSGFDLDALGNVLPVGAVGQFNADGGGNITSGQEDINNAGNYSGLVTLSGSYSVANNGRGLVTLNESVGITSHFVIYVISSNQALFVSLDPTPGMAGIATHQSGGLGNVTLQGNYVFSQGGITSDDGFNVDFFSYASAGIMHADGAGNISNGVMDVNDGNLGIFEALAFTGSYSATAAGRGSATLTSSHGPSNYVFYLVSPTIAYFLETDNSTVITGTAEQQTPASFSTSSLQGNFDFLLNDDLNGSTAISGQLFSDGSGNLSGTEDQNLFGGLTPNDPFSGAYSIDSTGRGTAAITDQSSNTTSNFHFYVLSGSEIRFVEIDSSSVLGGLGEKQF